MRTDMEGIEFRALESFALTEFGNTLVRFATDSLVHVPVVFAPLIHSKLKKLEWLCNATEVAPLIRRCQALESLKVYQVQDFDRIVRVEGLVSSHFPSLLQLWFRYGSQLEFDWRVVVPNLRNVRNAHLDINWSELAGFESAFCHAPAPENGQQIIIKNPHLNKLAVNTDAPQYFRWKSLMNPPAANMLRIGIPEHCIGKVDANNVSFVIAIEAPLEYFVAPRYKGAHARYELTLSRAMFVAFLSPVLGGIRLQCPCLEIFQMWEFPAVDFEAFVSDLSLCKKLNTLVLDQGCVKASVSSMFALLSALQHVTYLTVCGDVFISDTLCEAFLMDASSAGAKALPNLKEVRVIRRRRYEHHVTSGHSLRYVKDLLKRGVKVDASDFGVIVEYGSDNLEVTKIFADIHDVNPELFTIPDKIDLSVLSEFTMDELFA